MKILVTGGAGFIGSNLVRFLIEETPHDVVNIDKLTYAGNLNSIADIANDPRYRFEQIDITDTKAVDEAFANHQPNAVMHLAAESHVDRSIDGPALFVQTNVNGTLNLLQAAQRLYAKLAPGARSQFRFHHVSTDEVYGALELDDPSFTETSPYDPSSPYSASKAASDHLVRAWNRTYGLPVLISNCSNNYGPYQYPEKLIPVVILNAIAGKPIPVYGKGQQIRDWLYVLDHVRALYAVLQNGKIGATYNIGGNVQQTNIDLAKAICRTLDEMLPCKQNPRASAEIDRYEKLITFVSDRPGHDFRYSIDTQKIRSELGWQPTTNFHDGIRATVQWYLENQAWLNQISGITTPGQTRVQ